MNAEQLRPRQQVSGQEHDYVLQVIREIRKAGYEGPIGVVGSRTKWHRFSRQVYDAECGSMLLPIESDIWFTVLNELARTHDLAAGNLKAVRDHLPEGAPDTVYNFLNPENTWIHPDADLDLVVTERGNKIKEKYSDTEGPDGSRLTVDIFEPGEEIYIHLPSVFDF